MSKALTVDVKCNENKNICMSNNLRAMLHRADGWRSDHHHPPIGQFFAEGDRAPVRGQGKKKKFERLGIFFFFLFLLLFLFFVKIFDLLKTLGHTTKLCKGGVILF